MSHHPSLCVCACMHACACVCAFARVHVCVSPCVYVCARMCMCKREREGENETQSARAQTPGTFACATHPHLPPVTLGHSSLRLINRRLNKHKLSFINQCAGPMAAHLPTPMAEVPQGVPRHTPREAEITLPQGAITPQGELHTQLGCQLLSMAKVGGTLSCIHVQNAF